MSFGLSAATIFGGIGAATGLYSATKSNGSTTGASAGSGGSQTTTQQASLDPRMQAILYGDGTAANPGTLAGITGLQGQQQNAGLSSFGNAAENYVGANGGQSLASMNQSANGLMNSSISAPSMSAAQAQSTPGMQASASGAAQAQMTPMMQAGLSGAAQINAPSQNSNDLSGAYNGMINGNAGANPYLTRALQSGVDQTNASYQKNQTDLTNTLMRTVLPGIGDAAQAAGGYGGTRQGIAQGNAISDYTNQLSGANTQLGLANSANTTGAQASAYNSGQDRSLSAMNTLSGQQYGAASTNAQLQQQSSLANAANQQATNQTNYAGAQQTNLANSGYQQATGLANASNQQGANQTNYAGLLNSNIANAGYQQSANAANLQSGLTTNQLNSVNAATGIGANSGLLSAANTYGNAQNNYDLNRTGAVSGLLTQFTGLGQTNSTTNPLYSNTAGNVVGGATAGLGLYDLYNKANSGSGSGSVTNISGVPSTSTYANNNWFSE